MPELEPDDLDGYCSECGEELDYCMCYDEPLDDYYGEGPDATTATEPLTWDETEPLFMFDDNWGIYRMRTQNDRRNQTKTCAHCVSSMAWERYMRDGLRLFTLRDPEGFGRITINMGEANYVINGRAGLGYTPYVSFKTGDQTPRCLDGEAVICLEVAPAHTVTTDLRDPQVKRVIEWYEALPIAEDLAGYCGDWTRTQLQDWLRERGITNLTVVKEEYGAEAAIR